MSAADANNDAGNTNPPRYTRPDDLLRDLIRFDTTNPPGAEADCIAYIRDVLAAAGISSTILARDPTRPNLVARLAGRGEAPPLLLYGHVEGSEDNECGDNNIRYTQRIGGGAARAGY